jgi:hypothetical protein
MSNEDWPEKVEPKAHDWEGMQLNKLTGHIWYNAFWIDVYTKGKRKLMLDRKQAEELYFALETALRRRL